jgi:mono/diheme cytochrome c family protein
MKGHLNTRTALASVLSACLAMTGCGGSAESQKVSGLVSADAPVSSVSLKDFSVPANERTSPADANGAFSFDVNGLTPPFMLSAVDASGTQLAALATGPGTTNLDALTTAASFMSSEADEQGDHSATYTSILGKLRTVLAPLFDHYGVKFGDDMSESSAYRKMLQEVSFTSSNGQFTVTNKATGAVIYTAPLTNVTSGTLHPENIPGGTTTTPPPSTDGAALYTQYCAGCHGALASSSKKGATATQIQNAINSVGAMSSLKSLTSAQVQAIATALAGSTTPPPAACTYTYSAWGTCQSGTQTRTVVSSTPAGCTGTPVLSQSCTSTPPVVDGAALYTQYCASCHGALASSSKKGATASQIQSAINSVGAMSSLKSLTSAQVSAIAAALSGSTTPATCSSFTYSAWGTCSAAGTQTRTVVSSSPAGCTGGNPVLSQACTPPPVTCTSFTYSAWGACQSNSTQTRTVASSSPAGCTGGNPVLSQACTYTPPVLDGAALYTQYCASCHGALASSSKTGRTAAQISAAISSVGAMSSLSSLTSAQIQAIATALTPAAPPACTYTTGAWGACQSNGTQTRTVSASPSGCTGTPPASTQACTYVPPVVTCTSFTYSAWGTCSATGTQTRTVASSSPAGCTGGSPVLSQACTPPAPANPVTTANIVSSCTGCHGLTSNTTVFKSGGYTVSGRSASQWLSTVNSMVSMGASLAAGTTAQNYADFLAAAK